MSDITQLIQYEEGHLSQNALNYKEQEIEGKASSQEIERNVISIYEDDQDKIEYEDDYQFVLVKKPNPNPTIVMPTRIIKELNSDIEP